MNTQECRPQPVWRYQHPAAREDEREQHLETDRFHSPSSDSYVQNNDSVGRDYMQSRENMDAASRNVRQQGLSEPDNSKLLAALNYITGFFKDRN